MRRLTAFRALNEGREYGDQYAKIPAVVLQPNSALEDSYRHMVDENLVRKNISFAEMGVLASNYAGDPRNECPDADKAVARLFKSASYTKRSYIRAFATLMMRMGALLEHPHSVPRNVGVSLKRRLDSEPALLAEIKTALQQHPTRNAAQEIAILRQFSDPADASKTLPPGKLSEIKAPKEKVRQPRSTFTLARMDTYAKCTASSGRLELSFELDFSALDRLKLEQTLAVFPDALEADDAG